MAVITIHRCLAVQRYEGIFKNSSFNLKKKKKRNTKSSTLHLPSRDGGGGVMGAYFTILFIGP